MSSKNPAKPAARKADFFFGRIFPWLFFLPGVVVAIVGLRSLNESWASQDWPAVSGEIRSSEIVSSRSSDSTNYRAAVTYAYAVDGREFLGERIQPTEVSSSNRSRAVAAQARYPVGQQVEVFHDPDDPGRSLLEPGLSAGSFFMFGFGVVFGGAGLLMIIFLPKLIAKGIEIETEHQSFRHTESPVGVSREPLPAGSCYSWVPLKFTPQADGSARLEPDNAALKPGIVLLAASPFLFMIADHFDWESGLRVFAGLIPLFGGGAMVIMSLAMKKFMTKHLIDREREHWSIHSNDEERIPLDNIIAIQVIPGDRGEDGPRNGRNQGATMLPYQINLALTEDRRKYLLQSSDRKGCIKLAREIAAFLQVPLVGIVLEDATSTAP